MAGVARLRDFVQGMTGLADAGGGEAAFLTEDAALLRRLVAVDDWLPPVLAAPGPTYRQYLLHADPAGRFSVVSFVWAPEQRTPIHDHTVWDLVGQLRGAEIPTELRRGPPGTPPRHGRRDRLEVGNVAVVGAATYDIHVVENALPKAVSISIHCYSDDIGTIRRGTFDPATGERRAFVSGYAKGTVPVLGCAEASL